MNPNDPNTANKDFNRPMSYIDCNTPNEVREVLKPGDERGEPIQCIDLPLHAQVGKHDYVKLTPQEAYAKNLTLESEEYPWRAHIRSDFVYPHDWTRTKFKATVPVYTITEASLLASLRSVRDLLVPTVKYLDHQMSVISTTGDAARNTKRALNEIVDILSEHEVPSS